MSQSHSSGRAGSGVRSRLRGIRSSRSPSVHQDQVVVEPPRLDVPFTGAASPKFVNEGTSSHGASPSLPEIIASAERRLQPRLDPDHSPGSIWFDRSNEVITIVVSIFQSDFKRTVAESHPVPPSDLQRCLRRLEARRPKSPQGQHLSGKVQTHKTSVDVDGYLRSARRTLGFRRRNGEESNLLKQSTIPTGDRTRTPTHTAGQRSFARVIHEITQKEGEEPSALRLLQKTHRRADGTYISDRVQKIEDAIQAKITDRLSELEVVQPDAKGCIYGVVEWRLSWVVVIQLQHRSVAMSH
ncbi:PREDICTED: uncharacterized protein LOC109116826 [Tarenaya hassleriana]|uniref:uncharacterized protein LOC109116826 n=1 Tax=Tarenaya hassleriana TaxID=28532 RepID=UPI0008FD0483|nr:PREDICTED: uncharacterized protein LOC109116826 [Tarenaya hassleriana]